MTEPLGRRMYSKCGKSSSDQLIGISSRLVSRPRTNGVFQLCHVALAGVVAIANRDPSASCRI